MITFLEIWNIDLNSLCNEKYTSICGTIIAVILQVL